MIFLKLQLPVCVLCSFSITAYKLFAPLYLQSIAVAVVLLYLYFTTVEQVSKSVYIYFTVCKVSANISSAAYQFSECAFDH